MRTPTLDALATELAAVQSQAPKRWLIRPYQGLWFLYRADPGGGTHYRGGRYSFVGGYTSVDLVCNAIARYEQQGATHQPFTTLAHSRRHAH